MKKITISLAIGLLLLITFIKLASNNINQEYSGLYKVQLSSIEDTISMVGIIHPRKETFIRAFYKGYVKKLYVKHGDYVKKYDPLVIIEQSLLINEKANPMRAPYDGVVTLINKTEGSQVDTTDLTKNFILKLEDLSKMYLYTSATENDIIKIKTRQNAIIKVTSIPNKVYYGVIEDFSLSSKEEISHWGNSKVIFPVKIMIKNPDDQLRSGMSGIADIVTQRKENAVVIPNEFLHQEQGKEYVKLKDGTKKEVKIGIVTPLSIEVIEGLKAGEEIQGVDYFH